MKFFISALLFLSFNSYACFAQPEGLYEEHLATFFSYLGLGIFVVIASISLRIYINRERFWVPVIALLSLGYYPFYMFQLSKFGQGDYGGSCGIPGQIEAAKILLIGASLILLYEALVFLVIKYQNKNSIQQSINISIVHFLYPFSVQLNVCNVGRTAVIYINTNAIFC